jgi:hypothetical protein
MLSLERRESDEQDLFRSRLDQIIDTRHALVKLARTIDWPDLLAPAGTMDQASVATATGKGADREIKEWQAIIDHQRSFPVKTPGELPIIPVDERAAEVRAIKAA